MVNNTLQEKKEKKGVEEESFESCSGKQKQSKIVTFSREKRMKVLFW